MQEKITDRYLKPGYFTNSDHPDVQDFVIEKTKGHEHLEYKLNALYYAVRDGFKYDPYTLDFSKEAMRASHLVNRDYGYCVEKSCLFVAGARILGVPARLGFANVRNHIGTAKLEEILQTNTLVFHGYAEIFWNDRWLKLTPVFNESLCHMLNVEPLAFQLDDDSIFQEYDKGGGKFMEYTHQYGHFEDIPYELFMSELAAHYPHLAENFQYGKLIKLK
ncbi:transglutaminase-like domain-containing protein [Marivirga arenosa]|uniref:Transglutaminase-like domain-containing protein n=1 Tax=Marivirga arenosa TaxID=3059076 RepID=A0AA51ZXX0_9BACT|nr:transglutaminase-like domain-containing protein [Marivirga sp. BKB1-2]WNB18763.1 transglutaminase-like domain-containing protein [Marivirga sp. BKB1-2]